MSNYQNTCPKRTVTIVHHTVQTWLPVTLSCGHVEKVNWTARVGEVMGCISCQHALDDASHRSSGSQQYAGGRVMYGSDAGHGE